jgi:hypothetical protein
MIQGFFFKEMRFDSSAKVEWTIGVGNNEGGEN